MFHRLRYDNLKSAVQRVLRGKRREETTRFVAFRSHWRFASEFCTPGAGHEKGGVEGEVGYFRRNHWVALPEAQNLEELNGYLLACCQQDQRRQIEGSSQRVGSALLAEQVHLLPLVPEPFDLTERSWVTVDGLGCVRVRTNRYSAPLVPGAKVEAHLTASHIEIRQGGACVARHERCCRRQQILDLEHYLDALEKKPGALVGSTPLAQWRAAGRWPESFDVFWQALNRRYGRQKGTRRMIGLLQAGKRQGYDCLEKAITEVLAFGSRDDAAVRHLLEAGDLRRPQPEMVELGSLVRYEQPPLVMTNSSAEAGMRAETSPLQVAAIEQQCRQLRLPAVSQYGSPLAEQAIKERQTHLGYLEALLQTELEERERKAVERRIKDAHLPRFKTLEEFNFSQAVKVNAAQIQELAPGSYIERAESVILIGDSGTGKTHLLTGLCVAACRQKRRVLAR